MAGHIIFQGSPPADFSVVGVDREQMPMRNVTFGLISMAALASAASAAVVDLGWHVQDGPTGTVRPYNGENGGWELGAGPEALATSYRNWTGAPAGGADGALQAIADTIVNAGDLTGDDVNFIPNGANVLSGMGFNFANLNAAGQRLTFASGAVQFFDAATLLSVGGFTYNSNLAGLAGGGLDGGTSIRISFADNSLNGLLIALPSIPLLVTWNYDPATTVLTGGGTTLNLGQQVRNPIGVGTSGDQWVSGNTVVAGPIGAFLANTTIFLRLESTPIPEPTSLAVLGLGAATMLRRRR